MKKKSTFKKVISLFMSFILLISIPLNVSAGWFDPKPISIVTISLNKDTFSPLEGGKWYTATANYLPFNHENVTEDWRTYTANAEGDLLEKGTVNIGYDRRLHVSEDACGYIGVKVIAHGTTSGQVIDNTREFPVIPAATRTKVNIVKDYVNIPTTNTVTNETLKCNVSPNLNYPCRPYTFGTTNQDIAYMATNDGGKTYYLASGGQTGECYITVTSYERGYDKVIEYDRCRVYVGEDPNSTQRPTESSNSTPNVPAPNKPDNNDNKPSKNPESNGQTTSVTDNQSTEKVTTDVAEETTIVENENLTIEEMEEQIEQEGSINYSNINDIPIDKNNRLEISLPTLSIDTQDKIEMSWNAVDEISGYKIYAKKASAEEYQCIYTGAATTYTLNNFEYGEDYQFKIQCYLVENNLIQLSEQSAEYNIKTRKLSFAEKIKKWLGNDR